MGTVDFQEWINELREMPSGASQWEFASQFIEEMAHIVAEKEIERNRIAKVVGAIGDVIGEYSEELEFLKLREGLSSLNTANSQCDVGSTLEVIASLRASLVDYKAAMETLDNSRDHEFLIRNVAKLEQAAELSRAHYDVLNDLLEERPRSDDQQSDSAAEDEPSNTFTESVPGEVVKTEGDSPCEPEGNTAEQIEDGEQDAQGEDVANDDLRFSVETRPEPNEDENSGTPLSEVLNEQETMPAIGGQGVDESSPQIDCVLEDAVCVDDVSGDDNPTI